MVPKPHSMRIIALPLARVRTPQNVKFKSSDYNPDTLLVFYHFDLISSHAERKDPPWHKKVLKNVSDKATSIWESLGKAPKGSWKLWTYELGERMADKIEFEELALRNVDPSLGPTVFTRTGAKGVDDAEDVSSRSHPLTKVPFIFPPSLYPAGADHALAHLQALLTSRVPRHQRGFYLWMLIAPLTVPIILIPIIPNLPLFFCVWRSWSHYRAHRSSRHLSSILDRGLIELNPSLELDNVYASITSSSRISRRLPPPALETRSSDTSTFENITADRKSEAAFGTGQSQSECILLTREAMPQIVEMFHLPEPTATDIRRAMNQAHVRLEKSS